MVKTKQIKEIPKESVSAAISYVNSKTKTENFLELKN
jgi:ATP-dependent Lon protease